MQSPNRLSLFVDADAGGYSDLLKQKEREYRLLWEQRYNDLQDLIRKKDASYTTLQSNFAKLQEDFNYNLQLIAERDAELQKYDVAFSTMTHSLNERDEKLNDLKNNVISLQEKLTAEQTLRFNNNETGRRQIEALQEQINAMRNEEESEQRRNNEQFEAFRQDARFQIREKEQALEEQRRELVTKYETIKRQLELSLEEAKAEVDTLNDRLDSEVQRAAKLGEVRNNLETQLSSTADRADNAEEQVEMLQKELSIARSHAAELEHLSEAVSRDVTQWKERAQAIERSSTDLRTRLEAELESALREKNESVSRLQAEHTDRVSRLTTEHSRQLSELQEEHSRTVKNLLEEHRNQLVMTRDDHEAKVSALLDAKHRETAEATSRHNNEVLALKTAHDKEIENLRFMTAKDHEALRAEVARVAAERDGFLQRLDDAESRVVPHLKAAVESLEAETLSLRQQVDVAKKEGLARKEEVAQLQAERTVIINKSDENILALQSELAKARAHILALQSQADTRALTNFTPNRPLFPGDMGSPSGFGNQAEQAKMIELETSNERLRAVVADMRREAEQMHAKFADVSAELSQTQQRSDEVRAWSEKAAELERRAANIQKDLEAVCGERDALRNEVNALRNEVSRLQQDRAKLMELNNELRATAEASPRHTVINVQQQQQQQPSFFAQQQQQQQFRGIDIDIQHTAHAAASQRTATSVRPMSASAAHASTHHHAVTAAPTNVAVQPTNASSLQQELRSALGQAASHLSAVVEQAAAHSVHNVVSHTTSLASGAQSVASVSQQSQQQQQQQVQYSHHTGSQIGSQVGSQQQAASHHTGSQVGSQVVGGSLLGRPRTPPIVSSLAPMAQPQALQLDGSAHRALSVHSVTTNPYQQVHDTAEQRVGVLHGSQVGSQVGSHASGLPGGSQLNVPIANSERASSAQMKASDKLKNVHARRQELLDKRRSSSQAPSQISETAPVSVVGSYIQHRQQQNGQF